MIGDGGYLQQYIDKQDSEQENEAQRAQPLEQDFALLFNTTGGLSKTVRAILTSWHIDHRQTQQQRTIIPHIFPVQRRSKASLDAYRIKGETPLRKQRWSTRRWNRPQPGGVKHAVNKGKADKARQGGRKGSGQRSGSSSHAQHSPSEDRMLSVTPTHNF